MADIAKSLAFSPTIFLLQVVLFVALWNILSRIFFQPILGQLQERDQKIADAYQSVQDTQHEMEALRADYLARIAQVEAEARSHIQTAIREAQTERERLLAEARAQTEAAIRQGIAEMEREKAQALEELRGRMVGLAMTSVDKALGSVIDPTVLRATIEQRVAQEGA
jgi:F-type H+-transporting ATPase subunit b